jgi:predicted nucleic acid-binding protein
MLRAVIDTNVLFEGLTDGEGDDALIVDAWYQKLFQPCVSDTLAYEYYDVLNRKLSVRRWNEIRFALTRLISDAEFVPIHFRWRPVARDIGDDHLVDCAMNASACVVSHNIRDLRPAQTQLGLTVFEPVEFLERLLEDLGG